MGIIRKTAVAVPFTLHSESIYGSFLTPKLSLALAQIFTGRSDYRKPVLLMSEYSFPSIQTLFRIHTSA